MTSAEHQKQSTVLLGKITKARNASKANITLGEKLVKIAEVKALEEELRQHRLGYFDSVEA